MTVGDGGLVGTALVVVDVAPVAVGSVVVPGAPAGEVVEAVVPAEGVAEPSVGAGVELPVGAVVPPLGSVTADDALPSVGVAAVEVVVVVVEGSVDVDAVCPPLVSGGAVAVAELAAPLESSAAAGPAIPSAATPQHRIASSAAQRDRPALVPNFSPTDTLRRPAPCSQHEYLPADAGGHNLALAPDRSAWNPTREGVRPSSGET